MLNVCIFVVVLTVLLQPAHSGSEISLLKQQLFQRHNLVAFREFEHHKLDENYFASDYTKATRHYNTTTCIDNLLQISQHLQTFDERSMMLLDAWGDTPSGRIVHNLHDMGSYDECLDLQIPTNGTDVISTQYCLMDFNNYSEPVTVGVCMPDSCSPQLFEAMLNKIANANTSLFKIPYKKCQIKEDYSNLTVTDKIAIGIFTTILGLIIASTIYDGMCLSKKMEANKTLLAFSVYNNCKKWLTCTESTSGDIIASMNGIRVLARLWNLAMHTLYRFVQVPSGNNPLRSSFGFSDMILMAAPFSVDTFFLLSGTLTSITILKQLKRTNGKLNIPTLYLHRILRLLPLLMGTILFLVSLYRFCGNGPVWHLSTSYRTNCETNWWATLLHIHNYLNVNGQGGHDLCIPQSWYLAADLQLFLIAPFFVYLLRRYSWKMIPVTIVLVVCSILMTIFSWPTENEFWNKTVFNMKLRVATHLRYSPYLLGLLLGYIIFKYRGKKVHIPQLWNLFAWFLSLTSITLIIFGQYPFTQTDIYTEPIHFALYLAFGRIVWTLAVAYIIFACHHGYGGPINMILSLSLWQPLSKLTYAIYITHNFVILMTMATVRYPLYYTYSSLIYWIICNYAVSVFIAVIFFLMFESPAYALEPYILAIFGLAPKRATKQKPVA